MGGFSANYRKNLLKAVQRICVLRVVSPYKTVSYEGTIVISIIPTELLLNERYQWWNARKAVEIIERTASWHETLRRLHKIWQYSMKGRWTSKIP